MTQTYAYNVVDSCGWLAFIGNEQTADFFSTALANESKLVIPAICLYEVGKRILQTHGSETAERTYRVMSKLKVVHLTNEQLFDCAKFSIHHKLAMGDALVWYTAQLYKAQLFTQDKAFKDLPDVAYVEKRTK